MSAFTKNVIDLFEEAQVSFRESFLVWDKDIGSGMRKPSGEDPFHENIEIEAWMLREPAMPEWDLAAMAAGDLVSGVL